MWCYSKIWIRFDFDKIPPQASKFAEISFRVGGNKVVAQMFILYIILRFDSYQWTCAFWNEFDQCMNEWVNEREKRNENLNQFIIYMYIINWEESVNVIYMSMSMSMSMCFGVIKIDVMMWWLVVLFITHYNLYKLKKIVHF